MKDNTQNAHTKFQKYTTSPAVVKAKLKTIFWFENHPVGLVVSNFEGHVDIQISHQMRSCKFSKFHLEILEQ